MGKKTLTGEQKARLNDIRTHWLNARIATGPADRERTQAGVTQAYREAKLTPPTRFVWVDSPQAGYLVANELEKNARQDCGASVTRQLAGQEQIWWPDDRNEIAIQVCDVIPKADGFSRGTDHSSPETKALQATWDPGLLLGGSDIDPAWWAAVQQIVTRRGMWWWKAEGSFCNRHRIPAFIHGREGARQLAYREALDVLSTRDFAATPGLDIVAEEASWWWPFGKVAVICERPIFERRDSRFRLHNERGPALVYPDGYSICAIHGTKVAPIEILNRHADVAGGSE